MARVFIKTSRRVLFLLVIFFVRPKTRFVFPLGACGARFIIPQKQKHPFKYLVVLFSPETTALFFLKKNIFFFKPKNQTRTWPSVSFLPLGSPPPPPTCHQLFVTTSTVDSVAISQKRENERLKRSGDEMVRTTHDTLCTNGFEWFRGRT